MVRKKDMISVTELRVGITFKLDGQPYQVLEYRHSKIGRGKANIKLKARNLTDGKVIKKTFTSGAKVEPVETIVKSLQFLYQDEEGLHFMDPRSFEQFSLPEKIFGGKARFLKEDKEVKILFGEGKPLSFDLPVSMIFEVTSAPPGVKGNSATASTKPIILDNGLVLQAPSFIKKGDRIKVDTRTGKYIERAGLGKN